MLPDGTYTGVVDRFEEDADGRELAVILLEADESVVGQAEVPRAELPAGVGQDAVLRVSVDDGDVVEFAFDPTESDEKAAHAQDRFERLADRPPNESREDSEPDSE